VILMHLPFSLAGDKKVLKIVPSQSDLAMPRGSKTSL